MLDADALSAVKRYFMDHPVIGRYLGQVSICLAGSHALGLGGRGADIDIKVIAPGGIYEAVRRDLLDAGRITSIDEPEEDLAGLTGLVGDYELESLEHIRESIQEYGDLERVFVYGHLVQFLGRPDLVEEVIAHCSGIPGRIVEEELRREEAALSNAVYAFLRSFQNEDEVGRLLSRAAMVRSALRLVYLAHGEAPAPDKHLFRLLAKSRWDASAANLIREFLRESQGPEEERYALVAQANDWPEMFARAEGTPAIKFWTAVQDMHGLLR